MGNQKNHCLRNIKNHIVLLTSGSVLGLVALLLVFCIPQNQIKQHIGQSISMIEHDFSANEVIEGYPTTLKGSFTDCLMLEYSVYDSDEHSILEQVLYMYRGESTIGEGWAPGVSLVDYISGVEQPREVEYSRYWHGYLIILKPLLYFMNFNVIRMLASYVQLFLVGWIVMLAVQRGKKNLGIAFLAALAFLYFPFLHFSLSLSICFYLMTLTILIQLKWNEKIVQSHQYGIFFFGVGMATAYFDFLTYPLVTLCFPLCIYLYLNISTGREGIKRLIGYSLEWSFGYLGLWFMKWIFTDVLVGGNTISTAFSTVLSRTGNASGQSKLSGFFVVLHKNLDAFTNPAVFLIIFIVIIRIAYLLIKQRKIGIKKNVWQAAGTIFIVAFYPLVWFFFTQNHSEEHWMYTCKILSISIFALICAVGKMIPKKNQNKEDIFTKRSD